MTESGHLTTNHGTVTDLGASEPENYGGTNSEPWNRKMENTILIIVQIDR